MAVFKFKCNSCGSTQCKKIDDGYKCEYCGCVQDVFFSEKRSNESQNNENNNVNNAAEIVQEKAVNIVQRNIIIKLLVCFFAGYLGVHKFLEGKILAGIIYFCTFGLFGIGLFIDIIKYFIQLANASKNDGGNL